MEQTISDYYVSGKFGSTLDQFLPHDALRLQMTQADRNHLPCPALPIFCEVLAEANNRDFSLAKTPDLADFKDW